MPEGEPWARVFARKLEGKRTIVVALLVDTEPMFERLVQLGEQREERAAHAKSRLLVIGLGGRTVPISDPLLVRGVERVDQDPRDLESFAALVAAMRGAVPSAATKVDLSQEEARSSRSASAPMVAALAWTKTPLYFAGGRLVVHRDRQLDPGDRRPHARRLPGASRWPPASSA